jgi:hypothetical protein
LYRPFSESASVECRGYSLPLQRAITDFSADLPFEQAMKKLKEHYGVEVGGSMARKITEAHGVAFSGWTSCPSGEGA